MSEYIYLFIFNRETRYNLILVNVNYFTLAIGRDSVRLELNKQKRVAYLFFQTILYICTILSKSIQQGLQTLTNIHHLNFRIYNIKDDMTITIIKLGKFEKNWHFYYIC